MSLSATEQAKVTELTTCGLPEAAAINCAKAITAGPNPVGKPCRIYGKMVLKEGADVAALTAALKDYAAASRADQLVEQGRDVEALNSYKRAFSLAIAAGLRVDGSSTTDDIADAPRDRPRFVLEPRTHNALTSTSSSPRPFIIRPLHSFPLDDAHLPELGDDVDHAPEPRHRPDGGNLRLAVAHLATRPYPNLRGREHHRQVRG